MAKKFMGKRVTVDLPEDLWNRFQRECDALGWSLKRAVAASLYNMIRDYGEEAGDCYRDVYANWPLEGGHSQCMNDIPLLAERFAGATVRQQDDDGASEQLYQDVEGSLKRSGKKSG